MASSITTSLTRIRSRLSAGQAGGDRSRLTAAAISVGITLAIATGLTFATELVARGSLADALHFFTAPSQPSLATVLLFTVVLIALDALLGRAHMGVLVLAPLVLGLAATGQQKAYYLGDPLYPADFLYGRQILELLPLLARERLGTAILIVAMCAALAVLIPLAWIGWRRRMKPLTLRARATRLAFVAPAIAFAVPMLDYSTFSWTRDRLRIIPIMWDQKENYAQNGFTLAFAMNVPMAKVSAPAGYSQRAIEAAAGRPPAAALPEVRPDIIMVMSESFWDPTRLPGVGFSSDPIATTRSLQSGHVFSPEFGGMTANVEFEALTGFSNAFLPYGSIPYQQYVRGRVPSLASFLRNEGYETQAMHPFEGWFWNRKEVYKSFGFEDFASAETLPALEKRGQLASDAALTDEIIARADRAEKPLFLFAVTLQNHGPYEQGRYGDVTPIAVTGAMDERIRGSIATFAEGMADSDRSLKRLIEWAGKRDRPTVIAYWGDHLPPLGPAYVETGFLSDNVPPRSGSMEDMKRFRETPLVVWSNRKGAAKDIGTTSPAFLPLLVMRQAGIDHPYYTGVLGRLHDAYPVVDRQMLIAANGRPTQDWSRARVLDPVVEQQRLIQHDILFGERYGEARLFPRRQVLGPLIARSERLPQGFPALISRANPV